jgi:hypothetical protein
MPRNDNDAIITISISVKNTANLPMAQKVLDTIRAMPEYASDDAELEKDTRRGGYTVRYEPFVFHKQP